MSSVVDGLPEGTLTADGLDDALVGFAQRGGHTLAVYDVDLVMQILMKDMIFDDAWEHFSYNIEGAWVGDDTPVFVRNLQDYGEIEGPEGQP